MTVERWHIGVIQQPISACLDHDAFAEVSWVDHDDAATCVADPFGIDTPNGLAILYESIDLHSGHGSIHAAWWDAAQRRLADPRALYESDLHVSYPYVFHWQGVPFVIPEMRTTGQVSAFELRLPDLVLGRRILLLDEPGISDPTIFRHGVLWWLLGYRGGGELLAWYAESPIGTWKAHPRNPLKVDRGSARPAGTPFCANGSLFRPSQDGSQAYGRQIRLNRIDALTPDDFAETEVSLIRPGILPDGPWHGIHTLAGAGGYTLLDAKRCTISPRRGTAKLRHRLLNTRLGSGKGRVSR